jgi:hypothetical protein
MILKLLAKIIGYPLLILLAVIAAFDIWGAITLGTITPDPQASRDPAANRVVLVTGATGSVGDGLLKAAIEDPEVETIYVVTRRSSPRIDAGVAAGRVEMILQEDFTDYSAIGNQLAQVNTVLWGLGTTSIGMEDDTYTRIHVDFPVSFVKAWLAARQEAPMSFHYITGMGTDPQGDDHWAREKGRAELEIAALAATTPMRSFGYRSAFVRRTSEKANGFSYVLEALLKPGKLVITSKELGNAMLEISARTGELPNGTLIDNADSIAYAQLAANR